MEARVTIIGLGVNDLKISTNFYENILGWKKTAASRAGPVGKQTSASPQRVVQQTLSPNPPLSCWLSWP